MELRLKESKQGKELGLRQRSADYETRAAECAKMIGAILREGEPPPDQDGEPTENGWPLSVWAEQFVVLLADELVHQLRSRTFPRMTREQIDVGADLELIDRLKASLGGVSIAIGNLRAQESVRGRSRADGRRKKATHDRSRSEGGSI